MCTNAVIVLSEIDHSLDQVRLHQCCWQAVLLARIAFLTGSWSAEQRSAAPGLAAAPFKTANGAGQGPAQRQRSGSAEKCSAEDAQGRAVEWSRADAQSHRERSRAGFIAEERLKRARLWGWTRGRRVGLADH